MRQLILYLARLLVILIGAWNIHLAILNYERGRYFFFGIFVMLAVYMAIILFDTVTNDIWRDV